MDLLPTLENTSENDVEEYISSHPINDLEIGNIQQEIVHWRKVMDYCLWRQSRASNPGIRDKTLIVGGIGMGVAGLLACFATLTVGVSVSVVGLAVTCYDQAIHFLERRKLRKWERRVRLVYNRWEALTGELEKRSHTK
jgi:hypothetical protein